MNEFILEKEIRIIKKLIYKLKNQHKNTPLYRRLLYLFRMVKKDSNESNYTIKIKECCENLFICCTSNLEIGHFISLSVVIMGICGRIWYLNRNKRKKELDEIDDIFNN